MSKRTYAIASIIIVITAIGLALVFVLHSPIVNAIFLIVGAVLLWVASMRNYRQRKETRIQLMRSTCFAVALVCFAISQVIASRQPSAIGAALALVGGVLIFASAIVPIVTAQRTP